MTDEDLEHMTAEELSAEGTRVRERIEAINLDERVSETPSELVRLRQRETKIGEELRKRATGAD